MHKGRLEAFSDAVIAIIMTIMVLELKAPHGATLAALQPLVPISLSYVLSFVYIGIYWNNHHHLLQATRHVNGSILWANLNFLFWLSLLPFTTAWMGENHFAQMPVLLYGMVLLLAAVAYYILTQTLLSRHGKDSVVAIALGQTFKEKVSLAIYILALPLCFINAWISLFSYVIVAALWLIPDRRIEKTLNNQDE